MSTALTERDDLLARENMAAAEPARLGRGILDRRQPRHRHIALLAPARGRRRIAPHRNVKPRGGAIRRQGLEHRVGVEGEASRVLAASLAIRAAGAIAPAASQLAADAAREKREADAGVIFETAILDGIDGDRDARQGLRQMLDD